MNENKRRLVRSDILSCVQNTLTFTNGYGFYCDGLDFIMVAQGTATNVFVFFFLCFRSSVDYFLFNVHLVLMKRAFRVLIPRPVKAFSIRSNISYFFSQSGYIILRYHRRVPFCDRRSKRKKKMNCRRSL